MIRPALHLLTLCAALTLTPACDGGWFGASGRKEHAQADKKDKSKADKKEKSKAEKRKKARREDPPTAPELVLFVVMDTVRADHTSLCGYPRPTTPTLQEMVVRGAVYTCKAYSPAPWTHPSHASFFTGLSAVEHHAVWVSDSAVSINSVTRVRPLDASFVTLAERFAEAGYQTAAISANMIVTPPSGLLQGFEHVLVADEATALRGEKFMDGLRKGLRKLDDKRPLFLFVNLYDAHDPYPGVPKDVDWLPQQPQLNLHPNQHDPKHPYYRYVKGLSSPEDDAAFLREVTNGYDWGIHKADTTLGEIMQLLIDQGRLERGVRVVVTSDHGELLGEHRLLRHGGFLYEPVVNVPVLYYDSLAEKQPTLPEPFSGVWVHDLLLHGELPDDPGPVRAVSEPNERDVLVGVLGGAVWRGTEKLTCSDQQTARYDLAADPGELSPLPTAQHPDEPTLSTLCDEVQAMQALPAPRDDDPAMIEALRAVGYME
jgi:hypothetical protein